MTAKINCKTKKSDAEPMSKKKRKQRVGAPASPKKQRIEFVARPFAGIANEEDLVAMAQILPAATASVRLREEFGGQEVQLVTLLPELTQGLKRADGEVLVALQTTMHSGDDSRDVAAADRHAPGRLSVRWHLQCQPTGHHGFVVLC